MNPTTLSTPPAAAGVIPKPLGIMKVFRYLPLQLTCGWLAMSIAYGQSNYESYGFTTLAGSTFGAGSTNGTGSAARFASPSGIAVDAAGNAYVADTSNHTIRKISPTAVVSTFAGLAGMPGSTDATGNAARFNSPVGVAVDATGNIYVADTGNYTIRKITSTGDVTTVAGSAGIAGYVNATGASARFASPMAVAADGAGNLYVADNGNGAIRKIAPNGSVTTLAIIASPQGVAVDKNGFVYAAGDYSIAQGGTPHIYKISPDGSATILAGSPDRGEYPPPDGPADVAVFFEPAGISVNDAGEVFVADRPNNTIRKVTPAGYVSTIAGVGGEWDGENDFFYNSGSTDGTGSGARFSFPHAVAVASNGDLYVADTGNNTIRKITPAAVVTTFAGLATSAGYADGPGKLARFGGPAAITVDANRNVYVADVGNSIVRKITPTGVVSTFAGVPGHFFNPGRPNNELTGLWGITIDLNRTVYITELNRITKITQTGEVSTLAGGLYSPGWPGRNGGGSLFNYPLGVAADGSGNVFVADTDNHDIRKITPDGVVSTLAGRHSSPGTADGTTTARFRSPSAVAVDKSGTVYVADTGNSTIRKITPTGVVTTFAGLGGNPGSADGIGSAARFNAPQGITVGGAGYVYVADTGNNTIRKITPTGVVTTIGGLVGVGGSTDAVGSAARFNRPIGIAVDDTGAIYVGDYGNNTIRVGRKGRYEVELLKVESNTPRPSGYTAPQWSGVFTDSRASAFAGTYFNATSVDNYIAYKVSVAQQGTYRVRVGLQTEPNKGMFQLAINGANLGSMVDEYSPTLGYVVKDVGRVTFNSVGNQSFKFTVTGKNGSSTGYTLAFDYIELLPVQ